MGALRFSANTFSIEAELRVCNRLFRLGAVIRSWVSTYLRLKRIPVRQTGFSVDRIGELPLQTVNDMFRPPTRIAYLIQPVKSIASPLATRHERSTKPRRIPLQIFLIVREDLIRPLHDKNLPYPRQHLPRTA